MSGHTTSYQKDSVPPPVGAVKDCAIEELPLVGELEPSSAAYVPECGFEVVTPVAGPEPVQPDRLPASKPPFVIVVAADAVRLPAATGSRTMTVSTASLRVTRFRRDLGVGMDVDGKE